MNIETRAYAAGIFDGEGYVDIYMASTSKASKSPSFMLRVIISQKDGRIMNFLKENFGGSVLLEHRTGSYIYRWDIRSRAAERFLTEIYPFVMIKKEQVDLALGFERKKGIYLNTLKGSQGFRQLSDKEIQWRFEARESLKKMKKEYAPYIKNGAPTTTKRKDPKGM
jgi:hypothetical protein